MPKDSEITSLVPKRIKKKKKPDFSNQDKYPVGMTAK